MGEREGEWRELAFKGGLVCVHRDCNHVANSTY